MPRLDFTPREISLLCECIEKTVEPIKTSDAHTDVVVELSIVYIRFLKVLKESLDADRRAFAEEYGFDREDAR